MCLGQGGAQHTPMIFISFFCLEWLKVKPSALNLSQALLVRKSGNKKKTTKTNKKQVVPRDGSQTAFQETRAGKNIGQILPQASNKKQILKNPGILSYEVLLTCPMINPVAFICPSPHSLPSPLYTLQVVEYFQ